MSLRHQIARIGTALAFLLGPSVASAQPNTSTGFPVTWISPWVDDVGTFEFRFDATSMVEGTEVRVRIYDRVTGSVDQQRSRIADQRTGKRLGNAIYESVIRNAVAARDPDGQLTVRIPLRSSSSGDTSRALITSPGTYPVEVEASRDGELAASYIVYLNRVVRSKINHRVALALTYQHHGLAPDRTSTPGRGVESVADSLRGVSQVQQRFTGVPLAIALDGGLVSYADELDAQAILAETRRAFANTLLVASQWQNSLPEELSTTSTDLLAQSMSRSAEVKTSQLGTIRRDDSTWIGNDEFSASSLNALVPTGVTRVVLPESTLLNASPIPQPGRPITITGDNGVQATALIRDTAIESALASGATFQSVNIAHAMLATLAFASDADTGAVIDLTQVDEQTQSVLAAGFAWAGLPPYVSSTNLDDLWVLPPQVVRERRVATPVIRQVRPAAELDPERLAQLGLIQALRLRSQELARTLAQDNPAPEELEKQLLHLTSRDTTQTMTGEIIEAVKTRLDSYQLEIRMDAERAVRIATRQATIPISVTNTGTEPRFVHLKLNPAPQVDVEQPEFDVTLQPGANRINVPLSVRSSGEFVVRVELSAPGGDLLTSSRLRIRSTAISGVGILISGASALFLLYWWTKTWRQARRASDHST